MNRSMRTELARQTVEIAKRGTYALDDGRTLDIGPAIRACLEGTRLFTPTQLKRLRDHVLATPTGHSTTTLEVVNETTLTGIARLVADGPEPVAALNFASAKNPGGGFLNGSQAQEESLARSSALYPSLLRAGDFYNQHRSSSSLLYSDSMILSPGCPIFRDDDGTLLAVPREVAFITSPAPNAGALGDRGTRVRPSIPEVFCRRSEYVLVLAAAHGYTRLVLGAWGCGVFRNDPTVVAAAFASHLRGVWAGRFDRITFSVLDTSTSQHTFEAFRSAFGLLGTDEDVTPTEAFQEHPITEQ